MKLSFNFHNIYRLTGAFAVALACLPGAGSFAATYQWRGTTSSVWSTAANWSNNAAAPTGGSFNHRLNVTNAAAGFECLYDGSLGPTVYGSNGVRGLVIGSTGHGNFRITGGTFATTNGTPSAQDVISSSSASTQATFTNDGGTFISWALELGLNNPNNGTLTLNAGTTVISNLQYNFQNGAGTVNLNGGTLTTWLINRLTATPGTSAHVFNFNGGTLVAGGSNPNYWNHVITRANVRNGGAKIDTAGNNISIVQPLLHSNVGGDAVMDGGLTKLGVGDLTLSGTNNFTGPTLITAGKLTLGPAATLEATARVGVAAGASLDVSAISNFAFRAPFTAAGSISNAAEVIGTGTMDLGTNGVRLSFTPTSFSGDAAHPALVISSGALTLNGVVSVTNNGALPLGSGVYVLIQQTTGSLMGVPTLSGSVAGQGIQAGTTAYLQINGGNLELVVVGQVATTTTLTRHAGTLSASTFGDTLQFDVSVSPAPPGGAVELRAGGVNGTLIGTGPLAGGSCVITPADTALKVGTHTNLVAHYLGYLEYLSSTSSGLSPAQVVSQKELTISGAGAANKFYDTTITATITNTALVGVEAGDAVALNLAGFFATAGPGTNIGVTSTSTLTGAGATNYTLIQPVGLLANIIGANVWTGAAGDTLWNTAGNWLGGAIPNGAMAAASFAALNLTADITVNLNAARTVQNLIFGDTNLTSAASWLLANNGNSANTLTLGGTTPTITVNQLGTDATATVSAIIAGTAGLTKTGEGTLVLTAANTLTGGTKINGGTLSIDGDSSLGAAPGAATPGNITLNGGTLLFSTVFTLNANRGITLGAGGGTLRFATGNGAYDGIISGSGPLVIEALNGGLGEVIGGASTFSGGAILIGPGIIYPKRSTVGVPGSLTSGPFGTGGLVLGGAAMRPSTGTGGDLTLGNATVIAADTTFPSVSGEYSLNFTGPVTLTNGSRLLTVGIGSASSEAVVFSGRILESGGVCGLIKAGTGRLILTGTNNYTGPTTISNGTFLVTSPGVLNATNPALVAGGTLGGNGTINGSVLVQPDGTLLPGVGATGTLRLNGSLTLNGTLVLSFDRSGLWTNSSLIVSGNFNRAGILKFLYTGPELQIGDTFAMRITAGTTTGNFSQCLLPALGYGLKWDTNQLAASGTITVISNTSFSASSITLNPATTYQQIHGVGVNFCLGPQSIAWNNSQFNLAFSPTNLNISFVRLANSFECALDEPDIFWSGWDSDNVRFIEMYRAIQTNGLITMSAWSPPGRYKSTGSAMGGTLAKTNSAYRYADYADWWLRSLEYLRDNSSLPVEQAIPDFISIQNEADFTPSGTFYAAWQAGCYLSGTESSTKAGYPQAFAAVKSTFQTNGFGFVKFIGPDTTTGGPSTISSYLDNLPGGSLAAIAHHPYQGSVNDVGHSTGSLSSLRAAYPSATIYMTEFFGDDSYGPGVPAWMMHCLPMHNLFTIEQANTYLMWGLSLSPTAGSFCALGHYSKFINPGDRRANVTSSDANVVASLYRQTNSPGVADKLVLVLINKSASYSYPTIATSNHWATDPLQRAWKVHQTADDGSTSYRLTLLQNETGAGLAGDRNLVLPPYSITTAIINTGIASNAPPQFTSIASNRTITAGQTLLITNSAIDPNHPAQALAFSLPIAPVGATLNPSNGILNWRPLIAQAGSNYSFRVVVADNAVPSLSATQNFNVLVNSPAAPTVTSTTMSNGQFRALINGSFGPDYTVQASTNLAAWTTLFTTNSPAVPFSWADASATNYTARFYRVLLGP